MSTENNKVIHHHIYIHFVAEMPEGVRDDHCANVTIERQADGSVAHQKEAELPTDEVQNCANTRGKCEAKATKMERLRVAEGTINLLIDELEAVDNADAYANARNSVRAVVADLAGTEELADLHNQIAAVKQRNEQAGYGACDRNAIVEALEELRQHVEDLINDEVNAELYDRIKAVVPQVLAGLMENQQLVDEIAVVVLDVIKAD